MTLSASKRSEGVSPVIMINNTWIKEFPISENDSAWVPNNRNPSIANPNKIYSKSTTRKIKDTYDEEHSNEKYYIK